MKTKSELRNELNNIDVRNNQLVRQVVKELSSRLQCKDLQVDEFYYDFLRLTLKGAEKSISVRFDIHSGKIEMSIQNVGYIDIENDTQYVLFYSVFGKLISDEYSKSSIKQCFVKYNEELEAVRAEYNKIDEQLKNVKS